MVLGKPRTIAYRWVIVVCSFVVSAFSVSIAYNCWSVFTIPMCEGLSLSRQQFSGLYTVLLIGQTASSLLFTRTARLLGASKILRISAIALPALLFAMSRIHSAYGLYLTGFAIGFFLSGSSFLMFSVVISNWFVKDCGLMTGIVMMSSGIVSVVLLPIVNAWITAFGWQMTLTILALILAAAAIPPCFLFLVASPEEAGLRPYGAQLAQNGAREAEGLEGYAPNELVRQPSFWLFVLFTIGLFLIGSLTPTVVPCLRDQGYDSGFAANVHAAGMLAVACFRIAGGRLCDRFGTGRISCAFAACAPLLLLGLLASARTPHAALLVVLGHGIGQTATVVCFPLMISCLFGKKHFAGIYGMFKGVSSLVSAAAPLIYGRLYAVYGCYDPSYYCCGGFYLLSLAGLFALTKLMKKPAAI